MNRIGIVDKTDKSGRAVGYLSGVVKFKPTPLVKWGFGACGGFGDDAVHLSGANSGGVLLVECLDQRK